MITHATLVAAIILAALGPVIVDVAAFAKRAVAPYRRTVANLPKRSD
jgi:hypothetical protein